MPPPLAGLLDALGDRYRIERFLSEIRTTARLQHPHILPLLDSGDADGLLYYVMPVVTGESLRPRLERERHLPITDAVQYAGSQRLTQTGPSLGTPDAGKWAISTNGGGMPRWSHRGDEIFYMDLRSNLVAVRVTPRPPFAVESRRVLFDASDSSSPRSRGATSTSRRTTSASSWCSAPTMRGGGRWWWSKTGRRRCGGGQASGNSTRRASNV